MEESFRTLRSYWLSTGGLQHKKNRFGWAKEVRTTKSYVYVAQGGICRVHKFFQSHSCLFSL
jgi:hypothetical protein